MRFAFLAAALATSLAVACDNAGSNEGGSSPDLQVIYFVRTPSEGSDEPAFELRSVGRADADSRLIVKLPAIRDDFALSTEGDFVALPTDYTDDPEVLLGELRSGTVTTLIDSTGGNGAVELGPDGAIALCRENGDFYAGNTADVVGMKLLVPGAGPAAGCTSAEWAPDGGLVFLAPTPLGPDELGFDDDYAFYILDASLEQTKVIPVRPDHQPRSNQQGPVGSTLSADGDELAYVAGAFGTQAVHVLDLESGGVSAGGSGYEALFSRADANLIAVWDRDEQSLVVRDGTDELARLRRNDDFAFAWCPDSSWIALASVAYVSLWNWRSGETIILARTDLANRRLIGDDVACVGA